MRIDSNQIRGDYSNYHKKNHKKPLALHKWPVNNLRGYCPYPILKNVISCSSCEEMVRSFCDSCNSSEMVVLSCCTAVAVSVADAAFCSEIADRFSMISDTVLRTWLHSLIAPLITAVLSLDCAMPSLTISNCFCVSASFWFWSLVAVSTSDIVSSVSLNSLIRFVIMPKMLCDAVNPLCHVAV